MATNFKITGKTHESKKGHYIVERDHEKACEQKIRRLDEKLEKHIHLPLEKAHHPDKSSQAEAPLPNMRKY
jgi:hypothetical protein